jgi:hypothetical protein
MELIKPSNKRFVGCSFLWFVKSQNNIKLLKELMACSTVVLLRVNFPLTTDVVISTFFHTSKSNVELIIAILCYLKW